MQENNIKFSIIVPVYNIGQYLPICLDSLTNQTYSNIEIICINDGSTDNSLEILNDYAKIDQRIKIINQKNQGVSVARNVGIDNSNGGYILFVDADDWLARNTCEILSKSIEENINIDILYFDYYHCYNNLAIPKYYNNTNMNMHSELWCHLFKKSFIENITFPKGIKIAEDKIFLLKVYSHNPKTLHICGNFYYYRIDNLESASHTAEPIVDLTATKYWLNTDEYKQLSNEGKLLTLDFWAQQIFSGWSSLCKDKYREQNNRRINEFLEYYIYFNYSDYKNLTGYKKLKYKELWKFLKNIRNTVNKLIYRKNHSQLFIFCWKLSRQIGTHCIILPYRRLKTWLRSRNEK